MPTQSPPLRHFRESGNICYLSPHHRILQSADLRYHSPMSNGEVLFEFTQVGAQMRVAAIDVATSTEVIVITPANAARSQMQQLALAKLRRKLSMQDQA